jgi:ATP-dependent Clp protease adapter protein ClpS
VPVHVHWSSAFALFSIACATGWNPRLAPGLMLGYAVVIAVHEAGHAVAARTCGLRVYLLQFIGFGGYCAVDPPRSARDAFIVFSAGLVAQGVLFVAALAHLLLSRDPYGAMASGLVGAFIFVNALLFLLCVVPSTSGSGVESDGRVLWRLLRDRWHGRPFAGAGFAGMTPMESAPVFPRETSLLCMEAFVPPGFHQGLEVLNDATTPVLFVMDVFMRHLGWSERVAKATAVDIHNRGGILIPLPDVEEARRIAEAIAGDAAQAGHGFVCRAVEIPPPPPGLTSAVPAAGSPAPPNR